MKIVVYFIFITVSFFCNAQTMHPLELPNYQKSKKSFGNMNIRRCFDKDIHSLLLDEIPDNAIMLKSYTFKYYRLNTIKHDIEMLDISSQFLPISFFSDDTLVVQNNINGQFLFYDINTDSTSDICNQSLSSILNSLPYNSWNNMEMNKPWKNIIFNKALTECIYWTDSIIVVHKYSEAENKIFSDTLFNVSNNCRIVNVMYLSNKYIGINIFDIPGMGDYSYIFDVQNKRLAVKKHIFLIEDSQGDYCIVWDYDGLNICRFDENTLKFEKLMEIYSDVDSLHGRFGFVSYNVVAWYTTYSGDYSDFAPLMNQYKLLKIKVIK